MLGKGLYTEDRLMKICSSENHYFYIIKKHMETAGIFYCYADRLDAVPFLRGVEIRGLMPNSRVGIGQSIALVKSARRRGLSRQLLSHGTSLLLEREQAKAILVPAWMKNGDTPARAHLERCGYSLLQIMEKPWASCAELRCPVCGAVPCSCDGALYIKWKEAR